MNPFVAAVAVTCGLLAGVASLLWDMVTDLRERVERLEGD